MASATYEASSPDWSISEVTPRITRSDAIWLSPIYPSPMHDFGYDVSDYVNIDPRFGTLKDFDDLLQEAHRLGLRVIMDLVLNHTSESAQMVP